MTLTTDSKERKETTPKERRRAFVSIRALTLLWAALSCVVIFTRGAAAVNYASDITTQLNSTGRTVTMPVVLKDGNLALGEITIHIYPDDTIMVARADLIDRLRETLAPSILSALSGGEAFLPLGYVRNAGVPISFDAALQELRLNADAELRTSNVISLAQPSNAAQTYGLTAPAKVSGYLNLTAGLDYAWGSATAWSSSSGLSPRLDIEQVMRVGDVVVENKALYEGPIDGASCPAGAKCIYQHASGFKRQSSRLVFDIPDFRLRTIIGDTDLTAQALQRSMDLLGVSIEKSSRKLAPSDNTNVTGKTSVRIDRPSQIDVIVNGGIVQHLQLRPGVHKLSDLPLGTGANQVELSITDDTGFQRRETFTAFGSATQLAPGLSEWGGVVGVPSYLRDNERSYFFSDSVAASGFFRYGLSDALTGDLDLQADSHVVMAGAGASWLTPYGLVGLGGAGSSGKVGSGAALDGRWHIDNFSGPLGWGTNSFHLAAEIRSADFHRPGDFYSTETGILYPEFNYWLRVSAAYSATMDGVSTTLSAHKQFADERQLILSPFSIKGDRFGIDLTVSRPLSAAMTGSVLVGYSNEAYIRDVFRNAVNPEADFRFTLRLSVRADDRTDVMASYDSANRLTNLSGYTSQGQGMGRWDTSVNVQQQGYSDTLTGNVALGYAGNRGNIHLSHASTVSRAGWESFAPLDAGERTTLRVGTSIAYADGIVAVGSPVRNGAFAVVHSHESLADKSILVGTPEQPRAIVDDWGPALVSDLSSFATNNIPVDVADLPVGYSLGAGSFDVHPHYRSGYALQVGSVNAVSLYGTLVDRAGQPIELATGSISAVGASTRSQAIFTNRSGKFAAEGLSAGAWIIAIEHNEGSMRFAVEVPKGAKGLQRVGTLQPIGPPS